MMQVSRLFVYPNNTARFREYLRSTKFDLEYIIEIVRRLQLALDMQEFANSVFDGDMSQLSVEPFVLPGYLITVHGMVYDWLHDMMMFYQEAGMDKSTHAGYRIVRYWVWRLATGRV